MLFARLKEIYTPHNPIFDLIVIGPTWNHIQFQSNKSTGKIIILLQSLIITKQLEFKKE